VTARPPDEGWQGAKFAKEFALDDVTRRQTTVNWQAHDKGSKTGSKQVAIPGYR
jgi:hypothetical protein